MSEDRFADVTTDELIEELDRRCESHAIGLILKGEQRKDKDSQGTFYSHGDPYTALGLATQLQHDIVNRKPAQETGRGESL